MMAMPDNPDDALENLEEDGKSSRLSTPMPIGPRPTVLKRSESDIPMTRTININYRHQYTLEKKNGDDLDIPELLESLAKHLKLESPSKFLSSAVLSTPQASQTGSPSKPKTRPLRMVEVTRPLRFTEFDIPDPPNL